MVISVNQLSLYGAVADLIKDLPDDQRAQGNLLRQIRWNKKFLLNLLLQKYKPMKSDRETYCKIPSEDLKKQKTTRRPEVIRIVLRSKFEFGRSWTILLCSSVTEWSAESIFMPIMHVSSRWKGTLCKRVDRKRCTIRPCLGHKKFARHMEDTALKLKFHLHSEIKPRPWSDMWTVAREMGSPRHAANRRRRTREGPGPACVQNTFKILGGTRREREGRIDVLPWYRVVGVAKPPERRKGGRAGLPVRASGRHVVRGRQSSHILEVRPGNRQGWWKRSKYRWDGRQLTLDKDRRLPGVPPHGNGSMYSQANVRAGKSCGSLSERCRPWSWTLKRCCGRRMGPLKVTPKVIAPWCAS